jgi:acetylornithine deacetylase
MDEPWVRMLAKWKHRVMGGELEPRAGTGINDMRYFNFVGIPSGCFGAGGAGGHAADEWLDLASMVPTAKTIGAFMLEWCGVAE